MNALARRIVVVAVVLSATAGLLGLASLRAEAPATQPAAADAPKAKSFPFTGHITGTNVRIRSGPDTNYYPVGKLSAGDEVTVYSEEYGWMSIAPPKGSYSLIDRSYVDKTGDNEGTVNGESVWVRAGSDLDSNRYAKQVTLPRGAKVRILGETEDGAFYKIAPPEGARVWVKAEYVRGAGEKAPPAPGIARADKTPGKTATATPKPAPAAAKTSVRDLQPGEKITVVSPTTRPAGVFGPQSEEIDAIDAAIVAESKKPLREQNWAPLIERLRPIAAQEGESVAKIYAQKRLDQLTAKAAMIASLGDIAMFERTSMEEHSLAEQIRRGIRPPPEPIVDGRVEARGELRPSQVFDAQSSAIPRRYRLVDPATDRTVAYVEAGDAGIDMNKYLGRYVAVRASTRRLTAGTVQPISVLPPEEVVIVEPGKFSPTLIELPDSSAASGQPVRAPFVGSPTTRPAPAGGQPPTTRPAR